MPLKLTKKLKLKVCVDVHVEFQLKFIYTCWCKPELL